MAWDDGGGGAKPKPAKKGAVATPRKSSPKKDIIRGLARINQIADANARQTALRRAAPSALRGMSYNQITRLGDKAGLGADDIGIIADAANPKKLPGQDAVLSGTATAFDVVDRVTSRPLKAAIVESSGNPLGDPIAAAKGAYHGSVEGKNYPGGQALVSLGQQSPEESRRTYESLPGWAKTGTDVGGDVLLDWSTYATFGSGALAKQAARTAAMKTVGQQAGEAVLNKAAQRVYDDILKSGRKAIPKDAGVSRHVLRRANKAPGGAYFMGKRIPGTKGMWSNIGPKKEGGMLSAVENKLRTRGTARQAERRGDLAAGSLEGLENVRAQLRGANFLADLKPVEVQKLAEGIVGKKMVRNGDVTLDEVREALDIAGGRVARESIDDPKLADLANELRKFSDEDFARVVEQGRLRPDDQVLAAHRQEELFGDNIDLRDPIQQDTYYPRYQTEASRIEEGRTGLPVGRRTANIPGSSPGYLNQRTNLGPASEYVSDTGVPKYELNPVVALGKHARDTAQDSGRITAFQDLMKVQGPDGAPMVHVGEDAVNAFKAADPIKARQYKEVKGPVQRADPNTGEIVTRDETILVHKYVSDEYEKVIKAQGDKQIINAVKELNALWASYAIASPGFVSRNVLQGNFFMGMVLAGAKNPLIWAKQLGNMNRMRRGITQFGDPYHFFQGAERAAQKEMIEQAIKQNAVESGFVNTLADVGKAAESGGGKLRTGNWSPLSTQNVPLRKLRGINQFFENWARLSVYQNKVAQGFDPAAAGAITRKYMIDYRDLAPANEAAAIVNPFLTWTYKSAPLILGTLAHDPRKIMIPLDIGKAVGAEGMRSEGIGVLPQWQEETGAVPVPRSIREQLPLGLDKTAQVFGPDSPIHSTMETLTPILKAWQVAKGKPGAEEELGRSIINAAGLGGETGGALKLIFETAAGKQFFSGRKFSPGQRVAVPGVLQPVLGKSMPWAQWNAISTAFPGMSKVVTLSPGSEYDKSKQVQRGVSQIAGIGLSSHTPATERSEFYRRLNDLNAIIKDLRDRGVEVPSSSTPAKKKSGSSSSGGGWG
jgi:hypothetical protein